MHYIRVAFFASVIALLAMSMLTTARPSQAAVASTGNAAVDATIGDLTSHRIEELLARIDYKARPCSRDPLAVRPLCAGAAPDGSLVASLLVRGCDGRTYFDTDVDSVRYRIAQSFDGSAAGSVFAVVRGSISGDSANDFVAFLNNTDVASPTENAGAWQITTTGRTVAIESYDPYCAPPGAVQMMNRYFGQPTFIIAPLFDCPPDAGLPVTLSVRIAGLYGDTTPQLWGPATVDDTGRNERAIVHLEDAIWTGRVRSAVDARVGDDVRVKGIRRDDCTVTGNEVITSVAPNLAVPAAPSSLRLTGEAEGLAWTDNSTDESGFRITALDRIAFGTQTFDVVPNATSFQLPPSARASCAEGRPSMEYTLVAVNSAGSSPSAETGIRAGCAGADPLNLPPTGLTGVQRSTDGIPDAVLWLALVGSTLVVAGASPLRILLARSG